MILLIWYFMEDVVSFMPSWLLTSKVLLSNVVFSYPWMSLWRFLQISILFWSSVFIYFSLLFFLEYINHTFRVSWLFKVDNLVSSLDNLHVVVNISVRITSETYSSHTHSSVLWWKHGVVSSSSLGFRSLYHFSGALSFLSSGRFYFCI